MSTESTTNMLRIAFLILLAFSGPVSAQVKQSGTVTPGHAACWTTTGVLQDCGTPQDPKITGGLGVRSTNQESICTRNSPVGSPGSRLCLGTTATEADLTLQNDGGGPPLPLRFQINGVPYTFPFPSAPINVPFLAATSYGVVADGVTSNDAALSAALLACSNAGTTLWLPPGKILLTGAGSTTGTIRNCSVIGSGGPAGTLGDIPSFGTAFLVTSTTVKPFILSHNWQLQGFGVYYPNQTGAVVYPPAFSDDGVNGVNHGYINNLTIVNAYGGLIATPGIDWSNITISNSSIYAVNDSIRQNATGDSWRISNVHWTHGPWASIVGYPTVAAYLNAADQTNTILHVTAGGGVTMAIDNSTSFAWRYGIKVDSGGSFINSKVDVVWDGVMTHIDTSAGGCMGGTTFSGSGLASYVPVFSSSGAVSALAQSNPMFNLGPNTGSCAGPVFTNIFPTTVYGSFLVSAGQNADISNSTLLFGRRNDGTDYYAVHVTANGGGTGIYVKGSKIQPDASTGLTKMHGVAADVAMNIFTVKDNDFLNVNEAASYVLVGGGNQFIGNTTRQTAGSIALTYTGTGILQYGNNLLDKPPLATIAGGGSGATVSGTLSGVIQMGSTNPTTTVTLNLPFPTPLDICTFGSSTTAYIYGGRTGVPAQYALSASADIHGTQLYFLCSGQQ